MLSNPLVIRYGTPEDDIAALDLLIRQLKEHHVELPAEELLSAIQSLIGDERLGFILLAWAGTEAVGVACISIAWMLEHGGKSAWLEELYVLPEFRGCGVGGSLLERVFEICRQKDCAAVDLEVEWDHRRAEDLYRRHGFEPLPRNRWVKDLRS